MKTFLITRAAGNPFRQIRLKLNYEYFSQQCPLILFDIDSCKSEKSSNF